jgi:rubrerythrin
MNIEEALHTALDLERRIRDVYAAAAARAAEPAVRRTLGALADEEQQHHDYLEARVAELAKGGGITAAAVETVLPSPERVRETVRTVRAGLRIEGPRRDDLVETLRRAQEAEARTGAFYERMAGELSGEAQRMFARFVEIERGHLAIVTAEIDSVTGDGFWFDLQEFRLESA